MQDILLPVYEHISKKIPDYMAEQIRQFVDAGKVTVLPPAKHSQSATAFKQSGTCKFMYNKKVNSRK